VSAFFTGWCALGTLWCIDTNDYGVTLWVFVIGAIVNAISWRGNR
jgi:hypothetical protein